MYVYMYLCMYICLYVFTLGSAGMHAAKFVHVWGDRGNGLSLALKIFIEEALRVGSDRDFRSAGPATCSLLLA